jgi:DNA sulfur modification protein DndC
MNRYEQGRIRGVLSPNGSLANSWVFTPIENWSNDDVWLYLMQYKNPWGWSNKDLLSMYRGASADNECPLVLDTATPSCGNSRFGCWVCTLVAADKSMQAMIHNDEEKAWMLPLLEFRNEIGLLDSEGKIDDRNRRDFRRMDGSIKLKDGRAIHGPYTKEWREHLLQRLLQVQNQCRDLGAPDDLRLISDAELREIRRIWVQDKHQFDDSLPAIYEGFTGEPYAYRSDVKPGPFGAEQWRILEELCVDRPLHLELVTSVLDLEQRLRGMAVRRGIYDSLEKLVRRCYFADEDDAVAYAQKRQEYMRLSQAITRVSLLAATTSLGDEEGGLESE